MKKSTSFLLALMAMLLMSSCVSTKKIVYFQDSDEVFKQGQQIMQQYEMRLKPADQVYIKITCSEPYTVDNDGYVSLPAVGRVNVAGCTMNEAGKRIEKSIIDANLIKDPEVTVLLLNARVAVLGAVKSPQVVSLTSERNTILDVLSRCGDIGDTGLRQKISNPAYYVQQNDMIYVEPNKSQSVRSSAFYTFLNAGSSIIGVISTIVSIVVLVTR